MFNVSFNKNVVDLSAFSSEIAEYAVATIRLNNRDVSVVLP